MFGPASTKFLNELGRLLSATSGDRRETAWLWQGISIANGAIPGGIHPRLSGPGEISPALFWLEHNHVLLGIAQQSVLTTKTIRDWEITAKYAIWYLLFAVHVYCVNLNYNTSSTTKLMEKSVRVA